MRDATGDAPVFVLVRTQARNVVVKEGQVEARVEQLVPTKPQQTDSIVLSLPHILLKVEEVQPNTGMQWRPENERVMASISRIHKAARTHVLVYFQPRQHQHAWTVALEKCHSAVRSKTLPPPLVTQQHVRGHQRHNEAAEALLCKLKASVVPAQTVVSGGQRRILGIKHLRKRHCFSKMSRTGILQK